MILLLMLLAVYTPLLSEEQRTELGLTERIPATLKEALEAFKKDEQWAKGFLGEEMYDVYLKLK